MRNLKIFTLLGISTMLLFLPIFLDPSLFFGRGNDLTEFFFPLLYFTKQMLLENGGLPLWNSLFTSGAPLLPDPQAPLFYLPNALFLFIDVLPGLLLSAILHLVVGSVGMYLFGVKIIKLDQKYALVSAVIYLAIPRTASFIQAGHYGLIASVAYIPFVLLFLFMIVNRPKLINSVLFAISLSGLFYTHPTTFVLTTFITAVLLVGLTLGKFRQSLKVYLYYLLGGLFTFGLTAITLLSQLNWLPITNRYLLSTSPDVYPKYTSIKEFILLILAPWHLSDIGQIDNEKIIAIGVISFALSIYGFLKSDIKRLGKLMLVILVCIILVIAANNASPLYSFLLNLDWYVFGRVSTRTWFVVVVLTSIFASLGLSSIAKKNSLISMLLLFGLLTELYLTSWLVISKPINFTRQVAPVGAYEFISQDDDMFRVFCTTRCFEQSKVAVYNLQTIGGYSTLQQKNYYQAAWGLTGVYWDYYSLAVPPIGSYKFGRLNPNYELLGKFNAKYIVSPYEISNEALKLVHTVDGYYIYDNLLFIPRVSNAVSKEAISYTYTNPHELLISGTGELLVSEIYNPDWKAFTDTGERLEVHETPNGLIYINSNAENIKLVYQPVTYLIGRIITFATIAFISLVFTRHIYINTHAAAKKLRV